MSLSLNDKVSPSASCVRFVEGISYDDLRKAQTAIPFDAPGVHSDWILENVKSGFLLACNIMVGAEIAGTVTYTVSKGKTKVLTIHSLHLSENLGNSVLSLLNTCVEDLAQSLDCSHIKFSTVRRSLIKQALALGWVMSEVVLFKTLKK